MTRAVHRAIWPCLLVSGLHWGAATAQAPSANLTAEDWQADLRFLVETIEAVHPRPFHRIAPEDFEARWRDLDRRLPEMDSRASAAGLMQIAALISDGHTGLRAFGGPISLGRWYPLRFDRLVEGTYITATDEAHAQWLGARVERLGGLPVEEVWDRATATSHGENASSRLFNATLYLSLPEMLQAFGVGDGGPLSLDIRTSAGATRTETVEPITWRPDFGWLIGARGAPGGAGPRLEERSGAPVDLPFRKNDPYWFEREGGLVYAQINQVQNSDRAVSAGSASRVLTLGGFFDELLAELDRDPPDKLVIDLRWNTGGNNDLGRSLPRELSRRPELDDPDRLFVITGRATYSAAMNLVSLLEDQTNATFVGEPPGGAPRHYGDATGFRLPRSGMTLLVSTLRWDMGVSPWDVRETMEPDLPAAPTHAAWSAGRDDALRAILAYRPSDLQSAKLFATWSADGHAAALAAIREIADPPGPVSATRVQQLREFTSRLFAPATGEQIMDVATVITERYPDSHEAWFWLGRVAGFLDENDVQLAAYQRAHGLRPRQDLIRRFWQAARIRSR